MRACGGETYKYDAFGRRAIATATGAGGHYVFNAEGLLLAEYTPAGVLVRNYLYLDGQPFALADAAANVSYVLNDQVGQPQKMLNGAGAVTWQRVSGIFGDTVSQPVGATAANPQRFPGQQYVAASGLHYNVFRDYDPTTGRYLESDPIGLKGGLNTYAYVDGNPVSRVDPTGEFVPLVTGAIGAGIGGAANALAQYARNGGSWDCFDWKEFGIATATGGVAGALAPVLGTSYLGAAALGGGANFTQYGLTQWANGQSISAGGAAWAVGTGAVGGVIGGKFVPQVRYDTASRFLDQSVARSLNNEASARTAANNFGRNFFGGLAGNTPQPGSRDPCGCR